ncbi:hypothetical protein [Rhodobacter ferrooxidans]|uniref:Uncharacterized protein n=1 Tax=Rhodobacter ferrooxidans TaxID=371731 RepID=C8RX13_9RHOB|nr:hypothetical protein [Rhodobacter sp. SW2]EEW26538.1 hypothetical protein Rsw2DRAFT_0341 [Rhodobacter sp. SW2]
MSGVILFPGSLPPGALVRGDLPSPAPVWLTARADSLAFSPILPGRVIEWRAQGGPVAQAVAANEHGTVFATGALQFQAEVNGGLVVPDAIADASCLTLGLIFRAGTPEARTLLALQPLRAEGSLFLDAKAEVLRLAQKGGTTQLPLTAEGAADQVTLVLLALQGGQVWLAANGGAAVSAQFSLETAGPAHLFLGCRGPRAGLRNKLGTFALSDVLLWPGQNLLATPGNAALNGAITLWQHRARHGL